LIQTRSFQKDFAAVAFALSYPTLLTWVYFIGLSEAAAGIQQASYTLGKLVQFTFPLIWVILVQKRRAGPTCPRAAGLAGGAGFGVAIVAAMLFVYYVYLKPAGFFTSAAGIVAQKVSGFGIDSLGKYAALAVFYSACHSFLEEYYWRWFVFAQLRRLASLRAAIVVSSLGFTAHHVLVLATFFGWASPATYLFSMCVAVGGAFWAWLYARTESLYAPWLSHLLIDAGVFLIGYDLLAL
jgi:membrane protease YdiL (CAAX protease family)